MTALEIRGVVKAFGASPVLRGVDLDVPADSLTAILGPSGCGKTTLLRLIAGFLEPDSGTISFGDRQVVGPAGSVSPQRRRVGYVPQEGALFPHLDVAGNITFGLPRRLRRPRRDRGRVEELLELVGLPVAMGQRYPHELSGGQQQRVALARALAPRPSVVLLDEPFSSLDAGLREGTGRAVAAALRAAEATAVLVTHDQGEALSLADQVAVMREGRLVQVGEPEAVYRAPADPEVGRFVGAAVVVPAVVEGTVARSALGAVAVEEGAAQGEVSLLVRPEQLVLEPATEAGVQCGVVTDVSYYGHDAAVRVELLPDGPEVVARILGGRTPRPGDVVSVSVTGRALTFAPPPR